ncbi:MAG: transporter, partial [Candidatus Accumulibacter sp.]|nr:transporter [Accumulibacter sp.]
EISYNRDRARSDGETERVRSVPVVYTYGLTDTLDIYAGAEYLRIRVPDDHARGFGNTVIGAKWRFFENEASGTSLALKPEVAIPVSSQREDDGLGTGKTSGSLTLILSQEVPFGSVHFNAGIGRDRFRHSDDDSDDNATNRHFSVAPVWDVSEQWKLAFDVGIDLSRSGGNTVRSKYAEIGAIYAPNEDIDLALGFIRTTDDEHPKTTNHGVTVGLTWRF